MRGNGKVFISHTHADNALCQPLLAALDAWGVDYWFDTQQLEPGQHLTERLQQAIRDRDIFIRICTTNTPQSYWMTQELSAFRSLQLGDQQGNGGAGGRSRKSRRVTVNLVLDPRFVPGPADTANYVVEAYNQSQRQTLAQLRAVLELPQVRAATSRGVSRRTAIGLGAAGVVALGALGGAGALLVEKERATTPPYPKPQVVAFTNPQTLDSRIRWYFKAGDDLAGLSAALAGGVLYVSAGDGLYALKPADGSIIWINAGVIGGEIAPPLVVGNQIYIAVGQGNLAALSAGNGSPVWTTQDDALQSGSQFTVAGGVLYELTTDGTIHALNAATGTRLWSGGSVGKPADGILGPTVANGVIYVGDPNGLFSALSAANGATLWTYKAGNEIDARAVVAGGLVYFGSNDQSLYALNAATGALVWRYTDSSYSISVAPVIAGTTAYIGIGQNIYAFDAASGKQVWNTPAAQDVSTMDGDSLDLISGQPAVAANTLYIVRAGNLYALDLATHTILWHFASGASGLGTNNALVPIVSAGLVYFTAENHTLYALSAS